MNEIILILGNFINDCLHYLTKNISCLTLVPPVIVSPPTDIAIRLGTTATFNCSAIGDPPPRVEWFRGTSRLAEGTTLTFPSVSSSLAGIYTCGVTSSAGANAASARLIIFGKFTTTNIISLQKNLHLC